jgi:hypothetical protein
VEKRALVVVYSRLDMFRNGRRGERKGRRKVEEGGR